LVQSLEQAEYAAETIQLHLRAVIRFGTWLQRRRITISEVNEATVDRYVQHERQKSPSVSGPRPYKAIGLRHLLSVLRQQGVIVFPIDPGPLSSVE
jgi:integrase/recombinase XerD